MIKKITALALAGAFTLGIAGVPAFAQEVKQGDTMNKIATQNNMGLNELASLNPQVKNLNMIYVGQNINTSKSNDVNTNVSTNTNTNTVTNSKVSSSEKDLMARLVRAEAESEPYAGKVAVAYVILNRIDSTEFPNTVHDVIYQSGQFSPVSNGAINKSADAESIKAVNEAVNADRSKGAGSLFFYNPSTATSRWLDSRPTTVVIGHHVFKK
jgi:N-acetylmuramoyl-L-alanine amidase